MIKFFFVLLLLGSYAQAQIQMPQTVNNYTDLKNKPITSVTAVSGSNTVMVLASAMMGDNGGGFFYWDPADSTTPEDATYKNVLVSTQTATGRWKRTFIRTEALPGGIQSLNGAKKEYMVTGTTDASGTITVNLTRDNTTTGTALFTDLRLVTAQMATVNTTMQNATNFYVSARSADLKTITLAFYKGNSTAVGVLGVNVLSFTSVGAGVAQNIKFEGF